MKKNNMKSIGILTGLWLLLFLNCGQRMAAQIRNKVCDTIPYEFIQEKIIIPVTVNGIKVKYIVDTGGRTGTMYDAATEMKATAAGYMRISDVNAQGSNYQEAHVQNVSIGENYKIKQLKTMVLPKNPFFTGLGVVGILGGDAFAQSVVTFDSLLLIREKPQILIMGDFNDTPQDRSISEIFAAQAFPENTQITDSTSCTYYNLFASPHITQFPGSHKYQGEWSQLDQIIVNRDLITQESSMHIIPESIHIFAPDFLLTKDKTWRGVRPFRTYYGFKYEGGFSDHLPLVIDFQICP